MTALGAEGTVLDSHLPLKSYHESLAVRWGLASLRVVSVCCLQQVYVDCMEFCTVCLCGTKFLFGEDQHFSEQMQKNELMDTYRPVLLCYCQFFFIVTAVFLHDWGRLWEHGASKLRCEPDPSLSAVLYVYGMWLASAVAGFFNFFLRKVQICKQCKSWNCSQSISQFTTCGC